MLTDLSALMKSQKDSPVTSNNRAKRMRKHGRRLSNDTRRLDSALVLDTMYLLICGTFVFFMHAGFAMLEAGTGRAKNVQAILIKNLLTVCVGTLGWYLLGWSLAYGGDVKTVDSWKDGTFEDCPDDA